MTSSFERLRMTDRIRNLLRLVAVFTLAFTLLPTTGWAQERPVVRAIMFWMEGCPNCHTILDDVLPPLQERFGDQFQITLVEVVSLEDVEVLFQVGEAFGYTRQQTGVPMLLIGDHAMLGSDEIPAKLPGLIERYLEALESVLPAESALSGICPPETETASDCNDETAPVLSENAPGMQTPGALRQPAQVEGYWLAIAIMAGMTLALILTLAVSARWMTFSGLSKIPEWTDLAIPLLSIIGISVAGYLAYIETLSIPAICGPIGDCNAVQSSPYAKLFGVLPVGVLGLGSYLAFLFLWLWTRRVSGKTARHIRQAILLLATIGVLFSLYLTYLEPFVIKAVCAWCLTSSVLITLILLASLKPSLLAAEPGKSLANTTSWKEFGAGS